MIFALFPNLAKKNSKKTTLEISEFLKSKGVKIVTSEDKAQELNLPSLSTVDPKEISFMVSLGGDGTILSVAHRHSEITAPIVGINMGNLGFMADITTDEIYPRLEDILEGNFTIQERLMIQGNTEEKDFFAINEIVLHRGKNPFLIELLIRVDGFYLNTFSADGLIISTPNGSTAYSLAAGGPILTPDLDAFVITPISPHTISNRPIVIKGNSKIEVEYVKGHESVEVNYDGFVHHTISKGAFFKVSASKRKFRLVNFKKHDFFSTLRKKLGWAGKSKIRE